DRRVVDARNLVENVLDVFRKDVQPLRRDDHLLLAAADVDLPVGADLADVAGVKPAVLEGARGLLGGIEIALRDVLAAHEDLPVGRDPDLDAGDGLANRALPGAERMVEGDDWRRLGEPVALDDHESEFAPERLEIRIERGRADDECPEL